MRAIVALALGAAVYCCGPKVKPPEAAPQCEQMYCEHDSMGETNCFCPE